MPKRIQRRRTRGWRKPPNSVIVDRTSIFGNPFSVAEFGHKAKPLYIAWINGRMPDFARLRYERVMQRLPELRGKDLICFCPEDAEWCHANELLRLANQ